jgi:hypothetical protein
MPRIHTPKLLLFLFLKRAFEDQFVREGGYPNFAQDLRQ